jgi:adenylosuccinate synthase
MMDVLGYLNEIPVCTAYEVEGQRKNEFPTSIGLRKAKPVYEVLKGWECDIFPLRSFEELPDRAKKYVDRIEELIQVPIKWISVGPRREAIIVRQ